MPHELLTWQRLRMACEWDIERVKRDVYVGERADVYVGRPQPTTEAPAWFDRRLVKGKIKFRELPVTDLRVAPPSGGVCFSAHGWQGPWRVTNWNRWRGPYVLVTAGTDTKVETWAVDDLCVEGEVKHWFAVQVNTVHPALTPMPIGVDEWMVPRLVAAPKRPWCDRDITVYLNARIERANRRSAYDYWRTRTEVVLRRFTPSEPDRYLADMGRSKFVVSPPGHGWDCHRTYEAIHMGAIPIVLRKPPASDVVETLPVMVVDDWAECTPERLNIEAIRCLRIRQRIAWDRTLDVTYWMQQIRDAARRMAA